MIYGLLSINNLTQREAVQIFAKGMKLEISKFFREVVLSEKPWEKLSEGDTAYNFVKKNPELLMESVQ